MYKFKWLPILLLAVVALASAPQAAVQPTSAPPTTASQPTNSPSGQGKVTLTLGGYSTPREAYGKIIPLFKKYWKDKTGQDVEFQESYQGSGAQSRAIVGGFEADVAALSLESDIKRIADAGLITQDWKAAPHGGMVSDSVAVIAVRKGNPKGIKDWNDLTQPGLDVLTPDPKVSGGAQWNVMALWGTAERGGITGVAKGDDAAAQDFLKAVFKNVSVLDKDARTSITNFEKGVGDAAITYENEVLVGKQSGADYEYVTPHSTILIENPVAVVDKFADKHGTRAVAEAFRDFLFTPDAQRIFAQYGLRSVDPQVAGETKSQFSDVQDLFKIGDVGGWSTVSKKFFGTGGVYDQVIEAVQKEK